MSKLIQISSGLYQLPLGQVNAFLIEDKGLTLVDTGYKNNLDKIFRAISNAGKDPYKIKQLILTHCHPDHAGSAMAIKRKLEIPVFAHVEEAALLKEGVSGRLPFQRTPGVVNWIIYTAFIKNGDKTNEPVKVDEELIDNDVLPVAGGIQVIHTPGHSAGHISLLLKNEGALIAGDICSNMMGLELSTVYEDRPLGVKSILKAAAFDFEKAVFGHGKALQHSADAKLKEKFEKMQMQL